MSLGHKNNICTIPHMKVLNPNKYSASLESKGWGRGIIMVVSRPPLVSCLLLSFLRSWRPSEVDFFLIRSNVCISWMYRYRFYDIKVHFWWPYKLVFSCISIEFEHPVNTFQIGLPIHTLESIVNYDVILHSFLEKMNRDWIQGSTADFLRLAAMHPFHTYLVTTTFYLSILMKNAFVL